MILTKKKVNTRTLVKVSLLSAISFIIMYFDFPLPLFPEWLKIDLSDIPVLVGSFAMGPFAGVVIEFVKNLLHIAIKGTITGGVGELANFVVGSALVFTAGYIYNKNRTIKSAIIGMTAGIIAMTIVGALSNYFVLLPLYDKLFHMGLMKIRTTLVLTAIVPFNILKGVMVSFLAMILYKRISPYLKK